MKDSDIVVNQACLCGDGVKLENGMTGGYYWECKGCGKTTMIHGTARDASEEWDTIRNTPIRNTLAFTRKEMHAPAYDHEEPQLQPLREWSDDLIGREVVCVKGWDDFPIEGQRYTISSGYQNGNHDAWIYTMIHGNRRSCLLERFALPSSEPETFDRKLKTVEFDVPVSTGKQLDKMAELVGVNTSFPNRSQSLQAIADQLNEDNVHSGMFTVENGQIVCTSTPPPICECTVEASWDYKPLQGVTEETLSGTMVFEDGLEIIPEPNTEDGWTLDDDIGGFSAVAPNKITHFEGMAVYKEWERRFRLIGKGFQGMRRWTRTLEPEIVEKYDCLGNYPLLNQHILID